ncbi:MAG: hypothetical protein FJ137_00900 [Deltaproteobacteria bacterium]|nr:hypothetical protein [Deltaproteobacteria bacterium]
MSTPAATRLLALAIVVVVVGGGCPITDNRDGIGRLCSTAAACPIDHFCLLDGEADDDGVVVGRCAPVIDYGECPAPSWPVKAGRTFDGSLDIKAEADLQQLADVTTVGGRLRLFDDEGASLALGDLCRLSGLQRVEDTLIVSETDVTTLDGLQSLSMVAGGIAIVDNPNLVDVLGLASLQFALVPPGRNFAVLLARNGNLSIDAVNELEAALAPAGIRVFGCGNDRGSPCTVDLTDLLGQR